MASSQSATANPCTECQKVHIIEAAKPKFEDYPYLLHEDKALNEPMENAEEAKSKFDPFTIHKGIYKGTTTFAVFVPKTLLSEDGAKKKCRIHVRFHGGGFCTGSATFAPWFAQYLLSLSIRENAIIISPNHPKLPESNGSELLSYIDAFWAWFGTANNLSNFLKIHNIPVTNLDMTRLLISGESAGGHLAAYSWLTSPPHLAPHLKALLLEYPMLRAYSRTPGNMYRGRLCVDQAVAERGYVSAMSTIAKLRGEGRELFRDDDEPPRGMIMSAYMSQGRCGRDGQGLADGGSSWKGEFDALDIFERVAQGGCGPARGVRIVVVHGDEDDAVPVGDSEEFVRVVGGKWGVRARVEKFGGKGHGFDYGMTVEDEGIGRVVGEVCEAWE